MKKIFGSNKYLSEWILLIGGLLLVAGVIGLNFYQQYVDIGNRERERLTTQARILNRSILHELEVIDKSLVGIRNDLPGWHRSEGGVSLASHRLRAFTDAMRTVRTMFILDANGNTIAASRPELLGQNFGYRPYFTEVRADPNPDIFYVTAPLKTVLGTWLLNVVRVIPGPDGEFSGIIVAGLDPEALRERLGVVLYHQNMWAAIAHGDGLQVALEPHRPGQDGINLAQPGSLFSRHMASGQMLQILEGTSIATGDSRLMALHTIRHPDVPMSKPLVVAVGRNIEALYAGWYQQFWLAVGLFVLLAGTSLPALAYVQQRRRDADAIQKKADTALAESEHFMRSLINIIPGMVGYWTTDLHCSFANASYLEWFGKTQEEMKGIHIHELFGEELFKKNEPYIRAALAGERQSFERTLVKPDGSMGYTWAHYIPDWMDGQVQGFFVLVSDITDLKRSEAALRENRRFLQDLIEHSGTLIFAKDKENKYLLINQMYEKLTGHSREQVLGHTDFEIYSEKQAEIFVKNDKSVMESMQTQHYEELLGAHYFLTTKFPLFTEDGHVNGVCGISADITAQKELQKKMEWLANTDMLTGLANRRHFHELAAIEISRAKRLGHGLAVLMLDIDHFKSVNDTYGHDVGDQVIAYLGETCRNILRDIDISGRLGGEEFAVLLPATSLNDAQEVAERLRRRIAEHQMALPENTILQFTVSIGCAHSADATLNIDQLLKVADQHLYQAKKSGRNRVVA